MSTIVFLKSLTAGLFSAVMIFCMNQMKVKYGWSSDQALLILFLFTAPLFFSRLFFQNRLPELSGGAIILLFAVLACFLGNTFMFKAVFESANPAYAFITGTCTATLLLALASTLFQGAEFSLKPAVGMIFVITGFVLINLK